MGVKGDKASQEGNLIAEQLLQKLNSIGDISSKKMFGGHGIFHQGKMFGLIDSKGVCFLKANDSIKSDRLSKGAVQHSKMPYYSIPDAVFENNKELVEWATTSIEASK